MPERPQRDVEQFIQSTCVIRVRDVRATAEYYRDTLGFTFDFGDATYAVVWRENAAVHLMRGDDERHGFYLFFWVEDVDALYREFAERGADIVAPPETYPYGLREFTVVDCNCTRLQFAMDVD